MNEREAGELHRYAPFRQPLERHLEDSLHQGCLIVIDDPGGLMRFTDSPISPA
jgi:hypothetical protein